jgi:hypothetical protein
LKAITNIMGRAINELEGGNNDWRNKSDP